MSWATISISVIAKRTWVRWGLMRISTGSLESPMRRESSRRARAGTMTSIGFAGGLGEGDIGNGEAEAVGRGHRQPGAIGLEVDAGEHGARIIGGGREFDPLDGLAEGLGVELDGDTVADFGDAREVLGVHGVDGGIVAGAFERSWRPFWETSSETVAGGSGETKSPMRREGTVVAPSSSIFAPTQAEMEISRSVAASLRRPRVRGQQDVGRDGEGGAGGDGAPDDRQAALEVFLEDLDFHGVHPRAQIRPCPIIGFRQGGRQGECLRA